MSFPSGSPSPWLVGDPATRALAAVEDIARDLARDTAPLPPGLNRGEAGRALFFAYRQRCGVPDDGRRAERHLQRAIDGLAEEPAPAADLYRGYVGVAWVVEHVAAAEEGEEDLNEEIDEALGSRLRQGPWRGELDLIGGLVGWGVYALERLPRKGAATLLPLVVSRLAERGERNADGIRWRDPRQPRREPDRGMAHGAAGVIALLARILREAPLAPAERRETSALLAAAVTGVRSSSAGDAEEHGDLAWCAGNAGLSMALLAAGRSASREDWEAEARRLALAAAARHAERVAGFDAALCHGTAGLAHLFHRLYLATGEKPLLAAAHRWLDRTLAQRRPGEGIGGFRFSRRQADDSRRDEIDAGFLGGSAGVGLALLAAASPVEPAWDRLLLLSGRSG